MHTIFTYDSIFFILGGTNLDDISCYIGQFEDNELSLEVGYSDCVDYDD